MGIKGDQLTNRAGLTAQTALQNLQRIEGLSSKKMFGGYGLFHEGKMFGLVNSEGALFFKADDSTREKYERMNCQQHARMPYFEVPVSALESVEKLLPWAQEAISVSKRN